MKPVLFTENLGFKSNQISFISLVSSKDYDKQPSGAACGMDHVGLSFFKWAYVCRRNRFWDEVGFIGISGNRGYQGACCNVLKDFIYAALTVSEGSIFQNGTVAMLKAY